MCKSFGEGYVLLSKKELLRLKKNVETTIEQSPKESLIASKSNGVWQYYSYCITKSPKRIYIPKRSIEYARKLAMREYCELLIREIDRQLKLKEEPGIIDSKKLYDVYEQLLPGKRRLVLPFLPSNSSYLKQWLDEHPGCINPYEITTGYDSERGEIVRSKSEKIIADKLYNMGITYSYECKLRLGGNIVMYPDFTILNPFTRRTWYWEHFGLTNDVTYRDNMSHKLNVYESNGIFLGDGLIITTEGERTPLDTKLIGVKIKRYLLE